MSRGKFWMEGERIERDLVRQSEDQFQIECVRYFDLKHHDYAGCLFHVPNGGRRSPREAAKLRNMGVRRGVPDLILPIPISSHKGLAIEMKVRGGKTSVHQNAWLKNMEIWGWYVIVIDTFDLFQKTVDMYMTEVYRTYPHKKYSVKNLE